MEVTGGVGDCAPSASSVYVFPGVPAHESDAQSCDGGEGERQPTLGHDGSDHYQSGGEAHASEVACVHLGSVGLASWCTVVPDARSTGNQTPGSCVEVC